MAAKNAETDPETHPRLFLKFFKTPIRGRRKKVGIKILNFIIGTARDPELKRIARKASKHFMGKVKPAKRDEFRRKCLKKLRAMRTRELKNGAPISENVRD